jgi:sec-independent protein translocase protein TatB
VKPALFDIAPQELLLCAVVALVVIGPKDLPRAMRTVGKFVAKVRGVGRHFRSSFDEMVREAELKEMEEAWAKENARIMREHPPEEMHDAAYAATDSAMLPSPEVIDAAPVADGTIAPADPANVPYDDSASTAADVREDMAVDAGAEHVPPAPQDDQGATPAARP